MTTLAKFEKYVSTAQRLQLYPLSIRKAYDEYLEDENGKVYLDLLSGSSVANIGYGNQEVIDAYAETAKRITYTNFHYTPTKESVDLSEKLFEISPGRDNKKIIFGLSGSDAIEGAIKTAQVYTGRKIIVNFKNAYHGAHCFSYLTSDFTLDKTFSDLKQKFVRTLDFPKNYEQVVRVLEELHELLRTRKIAGVLIEPIQGDGGNIVPPENFLIGVKRLCEQYDTLFISDEILTGAGRSGKWFAIEYEKIEPDLLVIGKGFGAGYAPFSAVIGDEKIIDSLPSASHVSSYFGHAPTCAVVLKIIEIVEREKLLQKTSENGEYFRELIRRKLPVYKVRGRGWVNGIEGFISNFEFGKIVGLYGLDQGIYCGYFGENNNTVRIHPPLTLSKKQVEEAVKALSNSVENVELGINEEIKKKYQLCSGFQVTNLES